jgi:hypothetical protein
MTDDPKANLGKVLFPACKPNVCKSSTNVIHEETNHKNINEEINIQKKNNNTNQEKTIQVKTVNKYKEETNKKG